MRMYDIILKKRQGQVLTDEEIKFFIKGLVSGEIPDYQVSALMMAIFFKGMNSEETATLTMEMAHSGDMANLEGLEGIKVDKHSTGGVGDKTTLIIVPIAAACGVTIAKMSGRGLGHTGGTVDKLESIPGFCTEYNLKDFINIVKKSGLAVIGQSGNLCPADKKLYALRDVTATVDNISLIASSIMSKKIAAGCDRILLDVKVGSGAFMKTKEDAVSLAKEMVSIGNLVGRKTVALITDMSVPLGNNIGNNLEVIEAVNVLKGEGPEDLTEVCIELAARMVFLGEKAETVEDATVKVKEAIKNGSALNKLKDMVKAQGGDASYVENPDKFQKAKYSVEIKAEEEGFITEMDAEKIGIAACEAGAGREKKEDSIDYSAGIILNKKIPAAVSKGNIIATIFASDENKLYKAAETFRNAIKISGKAIKALPHILDTIE
ncbi:MAG: pyrimidine-nucleoside phosphorylase [Ruminococcaceae bacterium]|nr:pyrimidine-nucleoside phosphorylase [Oscillospiraceae bacterium]